MASLRLPQAIGDSTDILRKFLASISLFVIFLYAMALLTFRWNEFLGDRYANYATLFFTDWLLLVTGAIIFVFMAVLPGETPKRFIRETAIVLTLWDALAGIFATLGVFVAIFSVYRLMGLVFPWTIDQILYMTPVLAIAALTETFVWQWFLARAFDTRFRYGFVYAQVAFAIAHPGLTPFSFVALVMLGLTFYYLTNPHGTLPFWMNFVFAAGVHVIYNTFVFAYGSPAAFLTTTLVGGLATPSVFFWVLLGFITLLVFYGTYRTRRVAA